MNDFEKDEYLNQDMGILMAYITDWIVQSIMFK